MYTHSRTSIHKSAYIFSDYFIIVLQWHSAATYLMLSEKNEEKKNAMDLCDSVLCYEDIVGQENRPKKNMERQSHSPTMWNEKEAMARMEKRMCETVKKSTMMMTTTTRARYAWHMFEQGASLFDYRRIYSWYSDSHRYSVSPYTRILIHSLSLSVSVCPFWLKAFSIYLLLKDECHSCSLCLCSH